VDAVCRLLASGLLVQHLGICRFGFGDGCLAFGFDDGRIFEFAFGNTAAVFEVLRERIRLVVGTSLDKRVPVR